MSVTFLTDGPENAAATVLLAHGAGAPMDSASMTAAARALAEAGLRAARFEFAYMAGRRTGEGKKPPPRAETLIGAYVAAVEQLGAKQPLIIGGKSMGGRIASMAADQLYAEGTISGLLCLGYPFHPPGRPERLRTEHLETLETPALICQGTRDQFGTSEEVPNYMLSNKIEVLWLDDGDHDLKPRKAVSGHTAAEHMRTMAETVVRWIDELPRRS